MRWCVAIPWLAAGAASSDEIVTGHYGSSFEAPSFANVTYAEIRQHLLQGRPFVVTDGAKGLPMASWTCDYVKKEFPDSRIRQEGGNSDINSIKMGSDWTGKKTLFAGADKFPEGAPKTRPFYWDIAKAFRDEGHRKWGKNPGDVVKKLITSSAVPYWLPEQESTQMGRSSEMWFHPPGAGAPAHMDPHCSTTVSFCFSGARKWRMMIPPSEPHHEGYFDGQIYGVRDKSRRGEWQPTFELEAPAGSAVVVFPGMVHETLSTGDDCSSSISQTFQVPVPAAYFRAFWPRFALIHEDVGHCTDVVSGLVTLGSNTRVSAGDVAKSTAAGESFAKKLDSDGNGVLSVDEIKAASKRSRFQLDELVSFHDVDGDGIVTVQEVVNSWVMFADASLRVSLLQRRPEL